MSRTIANTISAGITLGSGDNPLSVTSTGRVNAPTGYAIYAPGNILATGWTISNAGTIAESDPSGIGVYIKSPSTAGLISFFTNQTGGLVTGVHNSVAISGNGTIVNQVNATITSADTGPASAVYIQTGAIVNAGLLKAGQIAAYALSGGSITNLATGTINGAGGVYLTAPGTVTNAGTIIGTNPAYGAVLFDSTAAANRLIVNPGAVFTGKIISRANSTNVVELASSASAGTLSGFDGSSITNFGTLQFDAGAAWTVIGNSGATGLGSIAITGFTVSNTIDLTGFVAVSKTFASNALVLTNAGNAHATLHVQGGFSSSNFNLVSDGVGGTDISVGASPPPTLVYAQTVNAPGIVAVSETVTAGVMTLFNGGGTAVGTITVGTSLSTGDFGLQSDGSGGTNVVVHTATGIYGSGITLLVNPTTIGSAATISATAASGIGVNGPTGTSWTVTNLGVVSETGTNSVGISLASTGTVTNAASGRIAGAADGVSLAGGGVISAQAGGTISGIIGVAVNGAAATVTNAGSIAGNNTSGAAVSLTAGGSVTNQSGGTLSGSYGVGAASIAATVVNAGSIGDGTALPTGAAIALKHGGLIINQTGGNIIAGLQGIYLGGATGTVVNSGSVGGGPTSGNGIIIAAGAAITNQSGGVITGKYGVHAIATAATISNTGSIGGNLTATGAAGVFLAAGGSATNLSGGTITGFRGVAASGGTVVNAGSIAGNGAAATGVGVQLISGARLSNQSGGTITGFVGVYGKTSTTTLTNIGSISGNAVSGVGVRLAAGGAVTNQSGGTITGFDGILTAVGATVENAGSIGGTTAVVLGAGATNRLVIDPGAAFTGLVDGGNTIGAAFISTLELATGGSVGTLSGLGSQFTHFARTTIDSGAAWTLSGTNTVVAGATLTNLGTLTNIGTLRNSGTLTGGRIELNGGALTNLASGVITGTYLYGAIADGSASVVNLGTLTASSGAAIYLRSAGNTVTNATGASITGYNFALKLLGASATLNNLGQIAATQEGGGYGVYLGQGGLVTNGQAGTGTSTALIEGYCGVAIKNGSGTLNNYGTIIGDGRTAVLLPNGNFVVNGASGATAALIQASAYGVYAGTGTVTNYASIVATGSASQIYGVSVHAAGLVSNLGTASLIEGFGGVDVGTNGTITNAGTIASNRGSAGVSVKFGGGTNRLIVDPGAVFVGSISAAGTSTLELASASSAGTLTGLGNTITNFTSLVFDSGAQWIIAGNDLPSGLGTLGISGFTIGDTIDLSGFVAVSETFASNALVLTNASSANNTLHIQGSFNSGNFHLASDGVGGTNISFQAAVPAVSGAVAGQTTSDAGTLRPFQAVSVSDPNISQTETVTVTLAHNATPTDADGTLSGTGLSKTGTGIYTLNTGTPSAVSTALQALVFTPTAHQVAPGSTVTTGFTLAVTDTLGLVSTDTVTTVVATAATDVPVITGAVAGQTVTDAATKTPFSGLSISNVDFGQTETVTVSLSNPLNGGLSNLGGGKYDSSTGVYSVSGTDAAVSSAVDGLVFTPTAHQVAPDSTVTTTFTVKTTDTAGATATNTTTTVIATAVNDLPVISGAVAGQTVTDATTKAPFSAVAITDVDFGQTETVTVTLSNHLNGALSNLGGGTYTTGTGVYSVTGTDSAVTTAVNGLVFTPTAHQIAPGGTITTSFTIAATHTAGGTGSNSTTTVLATASNDLPVISGAVAGQTVTDAATKTPFSAATISDADFGQTETVTVTVSNPLNGTLSNLGNGKYNTGTGVYSVTGTDAAVTTALQALVFTPTAHQVAPGSTVTTTFTIKTTDTADATTSDATTTVLATAATDVPVIGGAVAGQTMTDATTLSPFSTISISDVDFGQSETVTVSLSSPLNGALSNLGGGKYDSSTGVYSVSGSDAVVSTAVDGLIFTPTAHQIAPDSSVVTTFTIATTDTAGATASNTTTTVVATAANDDPVITGVTSGQTTTDEATLSPFSGVTISDVDFGQSETVTITLSDRHNGTLSNLGGGSYDSKIGVYSVSGSDAAVTTAVEGLIFTPTAHQVAPTGSVTTGFTIVATDTANASATDTTTSVIATATDDPPMISGTVAGQTTTDDAADTPFSGVTISDVDLGQTESVTITLSAHHNGVLSNLGGGSYDSKIGVYSVTGSVAEVTTAVAGLIFTPTKHQVAPGSSIITTFTIFTAHTAGESSSDTTTTVIATAVNDPPTITQTAVNAGAPNGVDNTPFAGLTITDPDVGHEDTLTVTLSDPAGGTLSNLGGGSYDAATGVFSIIGTPGVVTAALQGLVFIAAPPAPGTFVSTTSFTVTATGPGGSATNSGISVTSAQQVLGLATGPTENDVVSVSPDGSGFAEPTLGKSNQAVIGVPVDGTTYTLPSGYQAAFLSGSGNANLTDTTEGNALLVGNGGNGILSSGTANDTLLGGSGQTTLQFTANATGGLGFGGSGSVVILDAGSNDTLAGADGTTSATISGSSALFFGGIGNATVVNSGLNNTLVGSAFQSTFQLTSDAAGAVVFGGTGSATILDAGSNNTLVGAASQTSVTTSGSNAAFFAQAGDAAVIDTGHSDTVVGGSGQSTVQLASGATNGLVFGGLDSATLSDAGNNDTLVGSAGTTSVTLSGANAAFFSELGDVNVLDAGNNDTIAGGLGATAVTSSGSGTVLFGGAGVLTFVGGASGATVVGGSGSASVSGGGGGTTLFGGAGGGIHYIGDVGNLVYAAGVGNETLDASGSSTSNQLFGGQDAAGRDLLIGGSGNDTIVAGSGSDTLVGGTTSHDLFVFFSANGGVAVNDIVVNVNSDDTVLLADYGAAAAANALRSAVVAAGSTTITLSDNTRITFSDVSSVAALGGHVVST